MRNGYGLSLLAAAALGGCATATHSPLREATGATAQTVCNAAFVSKLTPAQTLHDELHAEPGMAYVDWALRYSVDRQAQRVDASILGGSRARSVYRDGRGCTLVFGSSVEPEPLLPVPHPIAAPTEIAGHEIVVPSDSMIAAAVDAAFADPKHGTPRATQAIVIVHGGRIIAERYAPGVTVDTPLNSHSLAKSVVNALVGILVRQGKLRLDQPVAITGSDTAPPPTVAALLQMNAGFGFDEGVGGSIASRMWYEAADTAKASADSIAASPRSAGWGYCNRCFMILSKLIGDTIGGGPQGVRDFAERELFGPLGMQHAVPEFDQTGTLMGANAIFASARDFARFGLLYVNDGSVGRRRILPEGWVKLSSSAPPGTGYGAGFWVNTTQQPMPNWPIRWGLPHAPADSYFARGYLGQYVVIVPSSDLVIVRMGQSHGRGMEVDGVGRLTADVIRALAAKRPTS